MGFVVKNLKCKYKTSPPVLEIKNIKINTGEVVFFLGASGVGKSTILETLGLMNNTILSNNQTEFKYLDKNSNSENFLKIWDKPESYLADFRKINLSFIFQSTNLFSTLTAEDNVLLPSMLSGKSLIESKNISYPIFKKIFSKEYKEILHGKMIFEMSGGQRQRLAFVRAISSTYNVLFADEPTGNLDWANANNLMSYLIMDVKQKKSTAIIVSHDISLAVKHADKIIFIDKRKKTDGSFFGFISDSETYCKNPDGNWYNLEVYKNDKHDFMNTEKIEFYFKEKISKQNLHL